MKFRYIADDIASLLTEFYIRFRNVNPSAQKQSVMKLHMKTAIQDTFKYLYDITDDVYCITIFDKPCLKTITFGYDIDFDRNLLMEFTHTCHNQFSKILDHKLAVEGSNELISIQVTPFDSFDITLSDVTQLLDMDCV